MNTYPSIHYPLNPKPPLYLRWWRWKMLFKGGSSAWCPPPPVWKNVYIFLKNMFIILIHLIHESIRQLPGANLWTPTRALHWTHWGASRQPPDVPFSKSWIDHCDFPMYPYLRCLCSIPKVKPTILWWWWWWRGSTSFASFYLYTSSLSLHRISYILGGFWKWTPLWPILDPLPSLKTKSGPPPPFESQT
jgi:hypothetical protein